MSAYSNVEWCTGQLEMQFPLAASLEGLSLHRIASSECFDKQG